MHLNELNRTRPHLNKRRIGSRSVSSSLCFPLPPPLGVTVHAVRRHVFPSLPVFPYFSEFPLSPRNGSTHPRIRIGFREESTFFLLLFNNLPMIRNRETDIFERFIIIEKVKNDRAKKGKEKL